MQQCLLSFKKSGSFEKFLNEVERQGINLNAVCNVSNLLPFSEVKATVKSICRWTWKNFDSATFSAIQSARAKKNTKPKKANDLIKYLEDL